MLMGKAIEVTRMELSATALRELAAGTRDGAVVRRLLAIAVILEGHSRAEAARLNGMNRQTLRDWVHRYNDDGVGRIAFARQSGTSGGAERRADGRVAQAGAGRAGRGAQPSDPLALRRPAPGDRRALVGDAARA